MAMRRHLFLFLLLSATTATTATTAGESHNSNRPSLFRRFGDYLKPGSTFSCIRPETPSGKTVILVHGWGVRAFAMQELAQALVNQGFTAYVYDYRSSSGDLAELSGRFHDELQGVLNYLPIEEEIYVLTHSMGGLILRTAMADLQLEDCARIRAVVLLAPPNHGSGWARLATPQKLQILFPSLKDLAKDSPALDIPPPPLLPPMGVIAGKYDEKVSVDSTRLPDSIPHKHWVVPAMHPGLRKPKNVLAPILRFFKTGEFAPIEPDSGNGNDRQAPHLH